MKNIKKYLLLLVVFSACNDNIELNKNDLKKYHWLTPFISGEMPEFKGEQNVDLNSIKFSYSGLQESANDVLSQKDSVAERDGWTKASTQKFHRYYFKKLYLHPTDTAITIIEINIDTVKGKILFNAK